MKHENYNKMKERYLVIAHYPSSPFTIGDILVYTDKIDRYCTEAGNWIILEHIEASPVIFRKLEWYEFLKKEDFPEYVFGDKGDKHYETVYKIGEVVLHDFNEKSGYFGLKFIKGGGGLYKTHVLPATKEDYENYISNLAK